MGDISHYYGADLDLGAGGGLLYVDGLTESQQHIIKRLLTNPGDDIWNPTYGAGLGQFIGQPVNETAITNVVRSQIFQELSVAQVPEPVVTVNQVGGGVVSVTIKYTDADTGQNQTLTVPPEA